MKTLDFFEIKSVTGAGAGAPNDSKIVKELAIDASHNQEWLGAGLGMETNVIHGAMNNVPVNVPPQSFKGPTWNGSGSGEGGVKSGGPVL